MMDMTALTKNSKYVTMNKSVLFHLRSVAKIHQGFQTPRNNKSTRLWACFHLFLGVSNPDETVALVFDILLLRYA